MAKKEIIIIGARGVAKELLAYLEDHGGYNISCILDENSEQNLYGYDVVHPDQYTGPCKSALLAIGYPEHKQMILDKYQHMHLSWETFIHPTAIVSKYARIGQGCIIAPFVVIAGNAVLSDFTYINVYAAVAHDSIIGSKSSLMPYACVNGGTSVGEECLLATGAKVLPNITIGDRCRVSAGSIVMRDMPPDSLISGNPAISQPDIMMMRQRQRNR